MWHATFKHVRVEHGALEDRVENASNDGDVASTSAGEQYEALLDEVLRPVAMAFDAVRRGDRVRARIATVCIACNLPA